MSESSKNRSQRPKALTPKRPKRKQVGPSGYSEAVRAKALVAFRETSTVASACASAGISRQTWYEWVATDPAFQEAVTEATEFVTDELEREAIKRAKEGSDTLVIFLLKSRRRAQYGDRMQVTLTPDHPQVKAWAHEAVTALRTILHDELAITVAERIERRFFEALQGGST